MSSIPHVSAVLEPMVASYGQVGAIMLQQFPTLFFDDCIKNIQGDHSFSDPVDLESKWNWVWVAPASFLSNLVAVALAPVLALIELIAAAVFLALGPIISSWDDGLGAAEQCLNIAKKHFCMAYYNLIKTVYPTYIRIEDTIYSL